MFEKNILYKFSLIETNNYNLNLLGIFKDDEHL